jgi:ribosome-binding protein aMBF1 (putative translation factor)
MCAERPLVAETQTVMGDSEIPTAKKARQVRLSLAANVRLLRQERGYSQEELAAACEMSRSVIARIERGQHEPRVSTLLVLSAALGVDPAAFLHGLEPATSSPKDP